MGCEPKSKWVLTTKCPGLDTSVLNFKIFRKSTLGSVGRILQSVYVITLISNLTIWISDQPASTPPFDLNILPANECIKEM
jgi:hypothetical protein